MESIEAPRGLIVDLITPLNPSGSIDGRGLGRLLDRMIPYAQAIFLAGPHMGEGKKLSIDQRIDLFQKSLVVIRGQLPILVWITQETPEDTKRSIFLINDTICQRDYRGSVFLVDSPLYYHSNRGLSELYGEFCSQIQHPFILHNDPELIKGRSRPFKRSNIRTAILKELCRLPNVAGLIYMGSLDRAYNYQRACQRKANFRIYDGDENHFMDHPSKSGVVSKGANLVPKAWHRLTASSLRLRTNRLDYPDQFQQIWNVGMYLRTLKDAYHQNTVPVIKKVLAEIGIIESPHSITDEVDLNETWKRARDIMRENKDYSKQNH